MQGNLAMMNGAQIRLSSPRYIFGGANSRVGWQHVVFSRAELSHNKDKTLDFSAMKSSQGARSKVSWSHDFELVRREGENEEAEEEGF